MNDNVKARLEILERVVLDYAGPHFEGIWNTPEFIRDFMAHDSLHVRVAAILVGQGKWFLTDESWFIDACKRTLVSDEELAKSAAIDVLVTRFSGSFNDVVQSLLCGVIADPNLSKSLRQQAIFALYEIAFGSEDWFLELGSSAKISWQSAEAQRKNKGVRSIY